ncbi:cAMP-binding domain of CRP or a regulatory subunit of cAMP-dependent protein kinases [Dyadobacter koreensis]|uniref:cAMP-binding domain of CRP or a regulatory subunit of cAMP-dependent protein kinases n=2 Tax=Dyadobacter koreensis TaxID=408657 RepID=A0A1H6RSF1_9BACT|nr:cAMP-binding domain of CRP or a regulatory subunit of cAMP-dependent protein kinases [Dyadobacter koreensis]
MSADPTEILNQNLAQFAQLNDEDIRLAARFWTHRTIPKNEFFNFRNSVCRHIGFIVKGLFRVYYVDTETEIEHNIYFVAENTFLVSLKSFLTQTACPYNIEALEDSELIMISHDHLQSLYPQSHAWERFGRLLAEQYFVYSQSKSEALLSQSAEERYLSLLNNFPDLTNRVSLGHIASYLGIKGPSLSRIRAQIAGR